MYKRMKRKKLGRKKTHRESLILNQTRTLFTNGVLRTTTPKAKVAKSNAESTIAELKKDLTIERRRSLLNTFGSKELLTKALEYAKKEQTGVRIIKTGFRAGDNAQISKVELINFKAKKASKKKTNKKEEEVKETVKKGVNKDIAKRTKKESVSKNVKQTKQVRATSRSGL
jgi:large subunit ribosomal protein L17